MKCAKNCEADAITVSGNLAAIDYAKCTGCGKCAEVCTTGCIRLSISRCMRKTNKKEPPILRGSFYWLRETTGYAGGEPL